jgi:hypothetical protein
MAAEIVGDHHVATIKRGRQELLDMGTKAPAVERAVQHQRGDDPVVAKAGEERAGLPRPKRRAAEQALATSSAAP